MICIIIYIFPYDFWCSKILVCIFNTTYKMTAKKTKLNELKLQLLPSPVLSIHSFFFVVKMITLIKTTWAWTLGWEWEAVPHSQALRLLGGEEWPFHHLSPPPQAQGPPSLPSPQAQGPPSLPYSQAPQKEEKENLETIISFTLPLTLYPSHPNPLCKHLKNCIKLKEVNTKLTQIIARNKVKIICFVQSCK